MQKAEIIAEGAGYYGLDALTGGTLSEATMVVGAVALGYGLGTYFAEANSAYQAYASSCESGGRC